MCATHNLQYRTYNYRCFKLEFSSLSRLYWCVEYSTKLANQQISNTAESLTGKYLNEILPLSDFDNGKLHITASEFMRESETHISHLRLLLVVKACALLEEYLHRQAHYYAIHLGYVGKKFNELNEVGKTMIKPTLVSNLHESLKYFQHLATLNFGSLMLTIKEAYEIRCAVAHNGGIVDHETARRLPKFNKIIGQRIQINWSELNIYLKAIHDVATKMDECLPVGRIRSIEVNWLLQGLFDLDKNLTAKAARKLLITEYNYPEGVPSAEIIASRFNCPKS